MPIGRLKDYLDREHVKYVSIRHSPAYTAQEIAAAAHIHGQEFAKSVVVKLDGKLALVVVPASVKIDLELLRDVSGARRTELANEEDFIGAFPGCQLGAMPPFGNLYGIPVYVDELLELDDEIVFNAGTHSELIRMSFADFRRLAQPRLAHLSAGALA